MLLTMDKEPIFQLHPDYNCTKQEAIDTKVDYLMVQIMCDFYLGNFGV